jgi:membrane peptidoglycan carboxypeptidase
VGQHGAVKPVRWLRSLSWKKRIGVGAGAFLFLLVAFMGVGYALTSVPTPSKIATAQATRVLYNDGSEIGRIGKNRRIVPLAQMSKPAQQAVLAAEDRGFYSEPGISPKGIARALFTNVKGGGVSQGGSTITQQYAKNAFLTQERTFSRKIKEVFIALKMSQTVSKDTILEDYLNTIYFGRGAYGIEAAANTYFGTSAAKLTVTQSAVLASSIRSPAGYDPAKHLARAKERWAYVLDGMQKEGAITAADRAAQKYPNVLKPGNKTSFPGALDYVRAQVVAELEKHGFPEDRITAGGLTVRTTLSRVAEEAAIKAVEDAVPAPKGSNPAVAALAAVEPGTGKVAAYYGGHDAGGFDYAADGKGVQPGSSMKPYVLAAALEKGISLSTQYDGSNHQSICGQQDVTNDAGDPPFGKIDLATGLKYSVNTVYLRLACDVGPKRVQALAHAAGIPDSQPLDGDGTSPSAQIALGSGGYEVHVLDQATGYATFAAKGQRARAYFVTSVSDGGNEVYKAKEDVGDAFSEGVAADATYAMQQVVQGGTGTLAQLSGRPTAGKTGTTTANTNAWFAGFTPQLSTAVWVGRAQGGPLKGVLGISGGVYGGTVPAKVFKAFMDAALQGKPVLPFPPRANVGGAPTPTATTTTTATAVPSATASATVAPTGPPPSAPPVVVTVPPVVATTEPPPPTSSPPAATQSPAAQPAASP